jgi:hypothetical protein
MFGKTKEDHQRIHGICSIRTAYINVDNITIAEISEERNDEDEFDWVIKPYYDAIDSLKDISIEGCDLSIRKDEYIRRYVPSFVDRRTLPDNRVNLREELSRFNLRWNDRFEYMCLNEGRTNSKYYVSRKPIQSLN